MGEAKFPPSVPARKRGGPMRGVHPHLFTPGPDLAGLIIISVGESCSSCASGGAELSAPTARERSAGQVLTE